MPHMASPGPWVRTPASAMAFPALIAFVLLQAGGCVGYVMGWSDREVERQRRIIAELEVKNASLIEEVLALRAKLKALESQKRVEAPGGEQGR